MIIGKLKQTNNGYHDSNNYNDCNNNNGSTKTKQKNTGEECEN